RSADDIYLVHARLKAANALVELGQFDEAKLQLVQLPSPQPLEALLIGVDIALLEAEYQSAHNLLMNERLIDLGSSATGHADRQYLLIYLLLRNIVDVRLNFDPSPSQIEALHVALANNGIVDAQRSRMFDRYGLSEDERRALGF
ncbi:MAG: hypothetical protein KC457_20085, partial [Myxococcales bacterium]|nr:hypothetical protein [Myxococcales bacterium]